MKVRSALVTIEFSGSEPEKTPPAAGSRAAGTSARRGAKLATATAYPYVADPIREPASPSSWPFALVTPPASAKPEKVVQVPAPEPDREPAERSPARALGAEAEFRAPANLPKKAPPIRVPPPAGHTEPPLAPQFRAPDASDRTVASTVDASAPELSAEVASPPQLETPSLLEALPAASEATRRSDPSAETLAATSDASPPPDSQPAAVAAAAHGGSQPEPCLDERTSRARIVERLWEDPIREQLEVNLGATTDSNLYVGVDLRIANGGVFAATYQALPPGTHVSLNITLAGGLATSAHGRVTLQRESLDAFGDPAPGVCVAFELLSNEALALLEQFASIRTPWLIEDE
jgi:hypothetical protein